MWYKLDKEGSPVPLPDGEFPILHGVDEWHLSTNVGKTSISTVFLGLDHNYGGGPPVLFETMIFNHEKYDNYQERYCTMSEAKIGHENAVRKVEGLSGLLRKL